MYAGMGPLRSLHKLMTARRRAFAAAILIALAGLVSGRFASRGLRHYREGYQSQYAQFIERLAPLNSHLPTQGPIGYVAQPDPNADELLNAYRFSLAMYHVLPCQLERSTAHELVLFDADDPLAKPAEARDGRWTLIASGEQGIKLYRTRPAVASHANEVLR